MQNGVRRQKGRMEWFRENLIMSRHFVTKSAFTGDFRRFFFFPFLSPLSLPTFHEILSSCKEKRKKMLQLKLISFNAY